MEKGIAYRRAQEQRLKKLRQSYWGRDGKLTERQTGKVLHTPAICSCWMCGNPRRYFGERTIQEQRALQDLD